jgi:error-prone DNA polymerase
LTALGAGRGVELHARSAYSLLSGASQPFELLQRARELKLSALALTDVNGLYGIVEAREDLLRACGLDGRDAEGKTDLKLLYGSEVWLGGTPPHGEPPKDAVVALVQDIHGYQGLCASLSRGRLAAPKGEFQLELDELAERPRGLWILAGCRRSAAYRAAASGDAAAVAVALSRLRDRFGDRLLVELTRQLIPGDREASTVLADVADRIEIPVVVTNDVHFHERARKPLHDLLRCAELGVPLARAGRRLLPNAEAHLKSHAEMTRLFDDRPEAIERAQSLAAGIEFRLCDVGYRYLAPALPDRRDPDEYLASRCREGLKKRLGARATIHLPTLGKELELIRELDYAGYFLTMLELVELCAREGILCQGRGSAANSLVCFSLGITSVSPETIDMLFERFLSRERNEPPDIDLDIEHERREEVIQHVYRRYGRDHAGMVAEVIRYRARSALRDVGKGLGFSEAQLVRMSKFLSHTWQELDSEALRACGFDPAEESTRRKLERLFVLARALEGFPRHLSIHVGGFVLSRERLSELVPIENGRMADRTVIQWAKDDVEAMGVFKLDLLGLGMLTVLSKAFRLLAVRGVHLGLTTIPPEDPATYAQLRRADSVGVFQVESRAQMNMLPRLGPRTFYDLVIEVAIVRPGPIQGKMVHPYLRRRRGIESAEYPHPGMQRILRKTFGVPLFQEQVMRLAEVVGGYSPGEADQLRRDMASWRAAGRMERHREKLLAGMIARGLSREYAERIFQQIQGFGSYGFPESHAAAFAHLAYVSAYLKCHFPVEFACALLNSQPMGFYSPSVIVSDLKRHGASILPVDVQVSCWDCGVEQGGLRLGLRLVRGLGESVGKAIEAGRPYRSIENLVDRAALPSRALIPLAAAGALRSLPGAAGRRDAIWRASAAAHPEGALFRGAPSVEPEVELPRLQLGEELALDAHYGSAFPGHHPMELCRENLARHGVLSARELKEAPLALAGRAVTVAGLVITRQRPESASGVVFMTLEDETGHVDVAVSSEMFRRNQSLLRAAGALTVRGTLQADGLARSVSLQQAKPLLVEFDAEVPSHDFH